MIFENKVVQKLQLQKDVCNKKWSPKLLLNLKRRKIKKILSIFDMEN